jgi:hypothetical protein
MSIHTNRNGSTQVIRLETDMVMESDENAIKNTIEQALKVGTINFVLSVSIGALVHRAIISRLLLWCKETIWRSKGKLIIVEKNDGEACVFGALCESLHIPMYQNVDTAILTMDSAKPHESDA